MAFSTENMPKQAQALLSGPKKVAVYNATGGAATSQFATHNLSLIGSIPSGSIVHDNACGDGAVSRAILSNGASDVKIYATDVDQIFLDSLSEDVSKNSWPVEVSNQKSESLSFADNTFSHSINNIGIIFASNGGLDGAKEIYRTLKPGGTAVVNCWGDITWLPPFIKTVAVTRGTPPSKPPVVWADGVQIKKIMKEAGFAPENTRVEQSEVWAKTSDLRAWAEHSWAFLGGMMGGWKEGDEEKWEKAVDVMVESMLAQEGTKEVNGEVHMKASQWVVIATK